MGKSTKLKVANFSDIYHICMCSYVEIPSQRVPKIELTDGESFGIKIISSKGHSGVGYRTEFLTKEKTPRRGVIYSYIDSAYVEFK